MWKRHNLRFETVSIHITDSIDSRYPQTHCSEQFAFSTPCFLQKKGPLIVKAYIPLKVWQTQAFL